MGCGFCFACELQFGTGYPELGVPVSPIIVYLISYLKFIRKTQTTRVKLGLAQSDTGQTGSKRVSMGNYETIEQNSFVGNLIRQLSGKTGPGSSLQMITQTLTTTHSKYLYLQLEVGFVFYDSGYLFVFL